MMFKGSPKLQVHSSASDVSRRRKPQITRHLQQSHQNDGFDSDSDKEEDRCDQDDNEPLNKEVPPPQTVNTEENQLDEIERNVGSGAGVKQTCKLSNLKTLESSENSILDHNAEFNMGECDFTVEDGQCDFETRNTTDPNQAAEDIIEKTKDKTESNEANLDNPVSSESSSVKTSKELTSSVEADTISTDVE